MDALLRALYLATTIFGAGVIVVDMLGLIGDTNDDGGVDDDDAGDGDAATHGSGAPLLSFLRYLRTLVYFCAGFGPFGLAAHTFGASTLATLAWAVPGGVGIAVIARAFFRFQQKDVDSTLRDEELLFETAHVTVPISGGNMGKVRIHIGQSVAERYAIADRPEDEFRGDDLVQIVRVTDECVYVKRAESSLPSDDSPSE